MNHCSSWIFICGINNSGTTLLDHLIGMHPDVDQLLAEGQALTDIMPTAGPLGKGYVCTEAMDTLRRPVSDELIPQLKEDWLDARRDAQSNPQYILEKSPPNILRTPWLQEKFHNTRFISIIRNPYAFMTSLIRRRKDITPTRAMTHWANGYNTLLLDSVNLDHFIMVKYEDIIEDYSTVMTQIEKFLDLRPYDYAHTVEKGMDVGLWKGKYPYGKNRKIYNPNVDRIAEFIRRFKDDIPEVNRIGRDIMECFDYEQI